MATRKYTKSYNLDAEVHDWLTKQSLNESRSASGQLNKIIKEIMSGKKK